MSNYSLTILSTQHLLLLFLGETPVVIFDYLFLGPRMIMWYRLDQSRSIILLTIISGSDSGSDGNVPESRPVGGSDSKMLLGIIGKEKPFSSGLEISNLYCFHCAVAESPFANSLGRPSWEWSQCRRKPSLRERPGALMRLYWAPGYTHLCPIQWALS